MADLRCPSKKHAELVEPSIVEVKCNSKFCGAEDGAVVLHKFDATNGELISTRIFKDPQKGTRDVSHNHGAAVRSA
jgi:hypothetical protein